MEFQREWWTNSYKMAAAKTVSDEKGMELIQRLACENAVVIFSLSSCCMCHAVKRLFWGMGVNPTAYELDQHPRGKEIEGALVALLQQEEQEEVVVDTASIAGSSSGMVVPVVFVGGKLLGATDTVMASHINGTLVPLLKQAGALWL